MKIGKIDNGKSSKRMSAILPLVPEDDVLDYEDKTKVASFKLRTSPADADSPKYSFAIAILDGSSSARQAITWYGKINKIFTGLNITTAEARHNLIQELVKGAPLASYTAYMIAQPSDRSSSSPRRRSRCRQWRNGTTVR